MELPFRTDCLLFVVLIISHQIVCHDDDSGLSTTLSRQLNDLRVANLPHLYRHHADDSVPNGLCKTWIGTVVTANSTWEEQHCRQCHCDPLLGTVCTHPQCDITFHPYLESNCEKWSSDGCCCLRASCMHNGVRYAANDWFPLTPSDPCTVCKCDPSDGLPQCLEITCPPAQCVDATSVPDECCPVCPAGTRK